MCESPPQTVCFGGCAASCVCHLHELSALAASAVSADPHSSTRLPGWPCQQMHPLQPPPPQQQWQPCCRHLRRNSLAARMRLRRWRTCSRRQSCSSSSRPGLLLQCLAACPTCRWVWCSPTSSADSSCHVDSSSDVQSITLYTPMSSLDMQLTCAKVAECCIVLVKACQPHDCFI